MKEIEWLTIHASATPPSMNIGAEEINKWHLGKGWNGIGYHYNYQTQWFCRENT